MKIYTRHEIESMIDLERDLESILYIQKQTFIDFSSGNITLAAPIQLKFKNPHGDCHIKAGYKNGDDIFVVKVATGFYDNPKCGLPSGDGTMLVFDRNTGLIKAMLCDGGFLTLLRTAAAALVAAELSEYKHVGIIGTGNLSSLVTRLIRRKNKDIDISIWGRSHTKALEISKKYETNSCDSVEEIVSRGGLIVTTTPSHEPIIYGSYIKGSVHIIALGADEIGKQELDVSVFEVASKIIVDSKVQSEKFGDVSYALSCGVIDLNDIEELGTALKTGSNLTDKVIITDLTGIAAQDIAIAKLLLHL